MQIIRTAKARIKPRCVHDLEKKGQNKASQRNLFSDCASS